MPATFRLLHLSDLHIGAQRVWFPRGDPTVLEGVARTAFEFRDQIDAIVITGDVADTGTWEDINLAKEFISSLAEPCSWLNLRVRPTLAAAERLIVMLPGNHDRFKTIVGQPACPHFDIAFGPPYWSGVYGSPHAQILRAEDGTGLALVCADFTLNKMHHASVPLGHMGQGRVYSARLKELVQFSQWLRAAHETAVLWLVHFPPKFPQPERWLELIDDGSLISATSSLGITHILCGHRHLRRRYQCGKPWFHCAGTAAVKKRSEDTMIHYLRIPVEHDQIKSIATKDFRWDRVENRFVDATMVGQASGIEGG